MDSVVARRPKVKHPAESLVYPIDVSRILQAGVTAISVTSLTVSGPPDDETPLTVGTGTVTVATIEDDEDNPIAPGLALLAPTAAGTDSFDYRITAIFVDSQGNTRAGVCVVQVRAGIP